MTEEQLATNLHDQWWRLCNLYKIKDKETGKIVTLKPNLEQKELYDNRHTRNIILKARQLGMTTFIQIYMLDCCVFYNDIKAGIIAHTKDDAGKFFRERLVFAYDKLPESIRNEQPTIKKEGGEISFKNNSRISVGTSARSDSLDFLHVSEFGKICAKYPIKAKEVVTGAFNTLTPRSTAFIESTAEGRAGYFYDYCQDAINAQLMNKTLSAIEWKMFFFDWYNDPTYRLPDYSNVIPGRIIKYFRELSAKTGKTYDMEQIAWYASKEKEQGADMKQEFPSTPEEAFEQSIEGAYYSRQFTKLREQGRICKVPHDPSAVVHTVWDLGISDSMTIWFYQNIGREVHIIDYYENNNEGIAHYANVLKEKGYRYATHTGPHDIKQRELTTGESRQKTIAKRFNLNFDTCPDHAVLDGIEQVRTFLAMCWFDEEKCEEGITHLESYRKDWNPNLGDWKRVPRHDEHSHGADSFRYLAMSHNVYGSIRAAETSNGVPDDGGWEGHV